MNAAPIVRLTDVSKSFRSPSRRARSLGDSLGPLTEETAVLRGVSLSIPAGDRASLVGPSGVGKSTLMSLIAGLLQPDTGTVEIEGTALGDLDDGERAHVRATRIGIVLQSDNLIPFLSARENIELAMSFGANGARRSVRRRAVELLARFGVADRAEHRPRQLSGGEAQRVALAVSIANDPALLLADELVAQLDADTAMGVVSDVLAAEFAVLYVTHDVALADLADHRYELIDGEVRGR